MSQQHWQLIMLAVIHAAFKAGIFYAYQLTPGTSGSSAPFAAEEHKLQYPTLCSEQAEHYETTLGLGYPGYIW
jgi:hypothetical protein